jgi:hypothetical protein
LIRVVSHFSIPFYTYTVLETSLNEAANIRGSKKDGTHRRLIDRAGQQLSTTARTIAQMNTGPMIWLAHFTPFDVVDKAPKGHDRTRL